MTSPRTEAAGPTTIPYEDLDAALRFLATYQPGSLAAEEWNCWRGPVIALLRDVAPASQGEANIYAGLVCLAIATSRAPVGTDLAEVLTDEVIGALTHERRLRGLAASTVEGTRTSLTRAQAVARGLQRGRRAILDHRPGGSPGLLAVQALMTDPDPDVAAQARTVGSALKVVQRGRWPRPLGARAWKTFLASAHERGHLLGYTWTQLRTERWRVEEWVPRPPVQTLDVLGHSRFRLVTAAPVQGKNVPTFRSALRGSVRLSASCPWTIRNCMPPRAPEQPVMPTGPTYRKPSKAAARRLAREFASELDQRAPELPEVLEEILREWRPRNMPAYRWQAVRPLTEHIMRRSHIRGAESFKKHIRLVAALVDWTTSAGYPPSLEAILTGDTIDDYLRSCGHERSRASLSTIRSDLRRIASKANPERGGPAPAMAIPYVDVKPPYDERDVSMILRRIETVTVPRKKAQIQCAVALGLGAGLNTNDLHDLRRNHIDDRGPDGMVIDVPGPRARTVWLRHDCEELLRSGIADLNPNERILGRRTHKDTVRDLYDLIQPIGSGSRVLQGRLRNTWIARLMCEPVPLQALLQASGLQGTRTLSDIARYIDLAVEPTSLRGVA